MRAPPAHLNPAIYNSAAQRRAVPCLALMCGAVLYRAAQAALGIINSLFAPTHGPVLSAPFIYFRRTLPCTSEAGGVNRPRNGALTIQPLLLIHHQIFWHYRILQKKPHQQNKSPPPQKRAPRDIFCNFKRGANYDPGYIR